MHAVSASTHQAAELLNKLWAHVMNVSQDRFVEAFEEEGLGMTQYKLLYHLAEGDRESVSALGGCIGLSPAASSRAVDQLVRRGLIERVESPEDRRARLLHLTPDGQEVLERIGRARITGVEQFIATLPDEQRDALSAALHPIVEGL
jgi:MarR family 2-MHQ and catechol resistance regulon transcriptional repressor